MGTMAALAAVPAPATEIDRALVARHDEAVERYLREQVTDAASRWCGGMPDAYGLYHPGSGGGLLTAFATAFLQPASKFHAAPLMLERSRLAARFLERSQTPDGNIDLLVTNFNSPPDTGFVVHGVGSAACLAQRAGQKELLGAIEPFLKKAGAALAKGGVHTPNHRWVVCSALAQIHEVFPNPAYLRRIEQWLMEGIDIDADGQYTERSTGVYNAVVDRAFVVLAAKLKKPELLDPVRRNLLAMLYLLHPGYEVVTEISRRQDQYDRKDMTPYWFPLQFMAVYDRDGRFATLSDAVAPRGASLTTLMEYPELNAKVAHQPVPEEYDKLLAALNVVRYRHGAASATVLLDGDSHFASFRRGQAVIASVRFASAFFGKGQFVPERFAAQGKGYEMTQLLEAAYYQPLDPPHSVAAGQWPAVRHERRTSEVCMLSQSALVTPTANGLKLRLRSEGTPNVPLAVEIALREGGKLEGCEETPQGWLLRQGYATYRVGGDTVRFGPGKGDHRYTQVRGALPAAPGTRVYICGVTPFDHELEIS
jgi:hypothetical protein